MQYRQLFSLMDMSAVNVRIFNDTDLDLPLSAGASTYLHFLNLNGLPPLLRGDPAPRRPQYFPSLLDLDRSAATIGLVATPRVQIGLASASLKTRLLRPLVEAQEEGLVGACPSLG